MKAICLKSYGGFGTVGQEYFVTGILLGGGLTEYLVNDDQIIFSSPFFTITDKPIPPNWFCKIYTPEDYQYSYKEAVLGYYELCFDEQHYPDLVEREPAAMQLYFQRKLETEKSLNEWETFSLANDKQKQQSLKDYSV